MNAVDWFERRNAAAPTLVAFSMRHGRLPGTVLRSSSYARFHRLHDWLS
jgi:hypothetical protein